MNFLEHTTAALDAICDAMAKPRLTVFAWDGQERLTQVGADHFVVHVWTPVALAEGLLRMGCQTDDIPPGMAEGFAEDVITPLGFDLPWTISSDSIEAWVRAWRKRDG